MYDVQVGLKEFIGTMAIVNCYKTWAEAFGKIWHRKCETHNLHYGKSQHTIE